MFWKKDKWNVFDQIAIFESFSSVYIRKIDDLFKRKLQAESLIYIDRFLSQKDIDNALICQFSTGLNLIIVIYGN